MALQLWPWPRPHTAEAWRTAKAAPADPADDPDRVSGWICAGASHAMDPPRAGELSGCPHGRIARSGGAAHVAVRAVGRPGVWCDAHELVGGAVAAAACWPLFLIHPFWMAGRAQP